MTILLNILFLVILFSLTIRSIFKTIKYIKEVFKREEKY